LKEEFRRKKKVHTILMNLNLVSKANSKCKNAKTYLYTQHRGNHINVGFQRNNKQLQNFDKNINVLLKFGEERESVL
jgi:hypothetical protein